MPNKEFSLQILWCIPTLYIPTTEVYMMFVGNNAFSSTLLFMFNVYSSVTGGNQFGGNSVFTACDDYSFFWLIFLHHFFLEYVLVAYVTHRLLIGTVS